MFDRCFNPYTFRTTVLILVHRVARADERKEGHAEYRGTLMMIASPHVRAHDHGGGWSSVSHGDRDSSPRGVHADPLSPPDESIRAE